MTTSHGAPPISTPGRQTWLRRAGVELVLTPLAAAGLAIVMLGAVVVHVRRGESKALGGPLFLGVSTLLLAVLRFSPYSF